MEKKVNKDGGILELLGTGVKLEIPPGALLEEQLIKMRIVPHYEKDESSLTPSSSLSPVVELLPNNLKLRYPAKLTLPHCLAGTKGSKVTAKAYSSHHDRGIYKFVLDERKQNVQSEITVLYLFYNMNNAIYLYSIFFYEVNVFSGIFICTC